MSDRLSARDGNSGDLVHVITSFHLKLTRDVLEDNVKIALQNARTPGIATTHVLLEGSTEDLFARIDSVLAEQLSREMRRGTVVLSPISKRPTYFDIFTYANTVGGHVAVANSDVLFPAETVARIAGSGMKPAETCYVLTRWNVTPNGIYIQGMTPSPPWPETPVESLRRYEQNFFSYDAYVFRTPIAVPPDMASVFIGSLGCDTTLGALLKVAGYAVSNPTLTLQTAHFDVKPRSYRSASSLSDLDRNVDALCSALRRPEAGLSVAAKALLDENGILHKGRIWFGHPQVGKFGRALQRALGATPWTHSAAPTPLKVVKIKLDRRDIKERLFDLTSLVKLVETEHVFIEWELTGYGEFLVHAVDAFLDSSYKDEAQSLKQHQWQAFLAPEHATPDDRRLYADVMELFRRTLISPPTTAAAIHPLMAGEADALARRMADLLNRELEDETTAVAAAHVPLPAILMIDPDALNMHGHYLPYDLQLRKAASNAGIPTSFLMNARMDPAFIPSGMKTYPLLEAHSWEIAKKGIQTPAAFNFVNALSQAITAEKKAHPDRPLTIYMYCGSFEHARLVQEVMSKFDGVGAMIHLFWLSVDAYKSDAYLEAWSLFAKAIVSDPRIRLTVASEDLQALVRKKSGVYFDVAPHPSTTFGDDADVSKWPVRYPGGSYLPVVLFPGAMREEKGYRSSIDAVRSLTTTGVIKFRCVISGRTRPDTPREFTDALNSVQHTLVNVEDRALDDSEFVDFLARGDILVLPYKASAFENRPSGILIDAIRLSRPIIALEGTWLGEAVRRYGWGEVVPDNGGASIAAAARKMIVQYGLYIDAIRTSREGYISQNSWGRLLKAITRGVRPGPKRPIFSYTTVSHDRAERIGVDETAVVARLLGDRKGRRHLMLDVGAHTGTSAAYFNKLDWTIHCFEPDPANRQKLVQQYGGLANVTIDTRAVSDRPASGSAFYTSAESTGISALHAFRDSHQEAHRVDVTTVADYVKAKGIRKVDFLKIDVEGFDLSVLKGVPWDELKPDVIECEYEDAKTIPLGHAWEDIARYLRGLGYAVYISEWHPIVRYGIDHDWRRVAPYPGHQAPTESWGNILAFRTDPGYSAVQEAFEACVHRRASPEPVTRQPAVPTTSHIGGRDSYIRPTQTRTAAVAQASGPKPLTIFPIRAEHGIGSAPIVAHVSVVASAPAAIPVEVVHAPNPVVTPRRVVRPPPQPVRPLRPVAVKSPVEAAPKPTGPPGVMGMLVKNLLNRRAGRAMIAAGVVGLVGLVVLLSMPAQGDLRPLLLAGIGLLLLSAGGLYFAYRTMGVIRRLSVENATLQQRMVEISNTLAAIQSMRPPDSHGQGRDNQIGRS